MEQLPDDVVAEIFSYFPLKSAIKSKSLSKRYNKIVSNHSFIKKLSTRLRAGRDDPILFSCSTHRPVFFQTITPRKPPSYVALAPVPTVHASCNGLLLLGYSAPSVHVFCVCNPVTSQCQFIKLNLKGYALIHAGFVVADIDRCLLSVQYKVVAICWSKGKYVFRTFTPETHLWTTPPPPAVGDLFMEGFAHGTKALYVKGNLHWVLRMTGDIIAYDIEKEEARVIKGPPKFEHGHKLVFGEYQGMVTMISCLDNEYVIYNLVDYEGEKWGVGSTRITNDYEPLELFRGKYIIARERLGRTIYSCSRDGDEKIGRLLYFMDGTQNYNVFDPSLAKVSTIDYIQGGGTHINNLYGIKQSTNKLIKRLASSI